MLSRNFQEAYSKGKVRGRGLPQQAEVAQEVPGKLRPRIFLTFGTMTVVGRQPYAPAAFTPTRNPWNSFLEAESTPGHMVPSVATEKIHSVTPPGIDPETVRLVAQCSLFKIICYSPTCLIFFV
jgi:hypothetical protein